MSMNRIDIDQWDRKEHFAFFQSRRNPCVCITAHIQADKIIEYRSSIKINKPRLTDCLYYLIMRSANAIPEFRMRIVNLQPVICDKVDAAFTYIPAYRELHANCVAEYNELFSTFKNNIQDARDYSDVKPTLTPTGGGSQELIYLSCLNSINFTSVSNPWGDPWTDSVPRIVIGKYDDKKFTMPIAIEALHSFVDGIHIARFINLLSGYLDNPEEFLRQ